MQDFFKDIFEYHHHFNQKLVGMLQEYQDRITERSIPLFSHIVNAHQIWNSRILNTASLGVNDVHSLERCLDLDKTNFSDTLRILRDVDLAKKIEYKTSKGQPFQNTVREVLFQVVNHTTHHRGQIVSDLRQQGIAPPVTDYIFYKR